MKSRILILMLLIPILLSAGTWLDRVLNTGGNGLPSEGTRSWRLMSKTMSYPSGANWEESERMIYYYNSTITSQVDSLHAQGYDTETSQWTDVSYIHNTWLPGGEYLQSSVLGMRMMGMSFELMKTFAVYDNQDRLTHLYMYSQPFMTKAWEPMQRIHVVYNGNQFTAYTWEAADEERPSSYGKINFTFDTQGRVQTETEQSSADSLNWTDNYRTTYTWHPSDTTTGASYIQHIAHMMPQMLMMMEDSFIPGMISQLLSENWTGAWVLSDKDVYTYNANNSLAEALSYTYQGSAWENNWKGTYSYDTNHNLQFMDEYYWDMGMSVWNPDMRTAYNWEQSSAVSDDEIPAAEAIGLTVYPVPFSAGLSIRLEGKSSSPLTLEIFNLKGQMIHHAVTSPNSVYQWNASTPEGVYFIKASQDGRSSIRKALRIK